MATITGLGGSQVTGSGGGSMDPADLQRLKQENPDSFQQFLSRLASEVGTLLGFSGGGDPVTAGNRITGDTGNVTRGGINITGGGDAGPRVTGSGATNAPGSGMMSGGANQPAPGGFSIPGNMAARGAAGGGSGGGGRPPVTGSASTPAPGGGVPGINLAGMGTAAREAIESRGGVRGLASKGLGLAGKYAPVIGIGASLMQGDVVGAAGSGLGGLIGGVVGGPVGSIVGATVGGGAAKALAGGAAKAVEAVTGQRMQEGKSGLLGGSIPGLTSADLQAAETLRGGSVKTAREMLPLYEQYRGVDMQNQMRLNQQLGQLTGALNKQQYAAQLAGGAQQQAGQTVRDILASSNPYAASVFRAG